MLVYVGVKHGARRGKDAVLEAHQGLGAVLVDYRSAEHLLVGHLRARVVFDGRRLRHAMRERHPELRLLGSGAADRHPRVLLGRVVARLVLVARERGNRDEPDVVAGAHGVVGVLVVGVALLDLVLRGRGLGPQVHAGLRAAAALDVLEGRVAYRGERLGHRGLEEPQGARGGLGRLHDDRGALVHDEVVLVKEAALGAKARSHVAVAVVGAAGRAVREAVRRRERDGDDGDGVLHQRGVVGDGAGEAVEFLVVLPVLAVFHRVRPVAGTEALRDVLHAPFYDETVQHVLVAQLLLELQVNFVGVAVAFVVTHLGERHGHGLRGLSYLDALRAGRSRVERVERLVGHVHSAPDAGDAAHGDVAAVVVAGHHEQPALAAVVGGRLARHADMVTGYALDGERPGPRRREHHGFGESYHEGVLCRARDGVLEDGHAQELRRYAVSDLGVLARYLALGLQVDADSARRGRRLRNGHARQWDSDFIEARDRLRHGLRDRVGHALDVHADAVEGIVLVECIRERNGEPVGDVVAVGVLRKHLPGRRVRGLGEERLLRNVFLIFRVNVDHLDGVAREERYLAVRTHVLGHFKSSHHYLALERTRIACNRLHRHSQRIVLPVVYYEHLDGLRVLRLVLVGQEYVETRTRRVSRALHRVAGLVLDGQRRRCRVALRELHVVRAVLKRTATVLDAGLAFGVRAREYRDVHLVAADAHLYRDIQIPQAGGHVVLSDDHAVVAHVAGVVNHDALQRELRAVGPDFRDVAALGDVGVALHKHGAARLVDFHVAAVGHVERRVERDIDLVVRALGFHFASGGAVAPHELVLAVHGHVGIQRGRLEVAIAIILIQAGHARVVGVVTVGLAVRHPAPVARVRSKRRPDSFLVGDPVPGTADVAVEFFVLRRHVERVVLAGRTDAGHENHVHAEAARALDDGGAERDGEIPLPCAARRVVGVLDLHGAHVAEPFVQLV